MVYSISSPSFGLALLTVLLRLICQLLVRPQFCFYYIRSFVDFADVKISTASTVALLGTNSFAFARSFIRALNS